MTINEIYRFWVDLPGSGWVRMYPVNDKLEWEWAKKTGYRFHQLTLKSKLIFMDQPANGINDFKKLYDLERLGKTCERVRLSVDVYTPCDDTWHEGWHTATLPLSKGDWNVSKCRVALTPTVDDAYTCLVNKWKRTVNMFDLGDPPIEVSPFYGEVQFEECNASHVITWDPYTDAGGIPAALAIVRQYFWTHHPYDCLTDHDPGSNNPWTPVKFTYKVRMQFIGPQFPFDRAKLRAHINLRAKWAREFVAGGPMPPGPLWTACTGGWHRPVSITNGPFYDWQNPDQRPPIVEEWGSSDGIWDGYLANFNVVGLDSQGVSTLTNGKAMAAVLQDFFATCGLTLVSNFYDIAPDGSNPSNDYYTRAAEDAHGLVLFQVTDVARLDETQSATIADFKPKDLIDTLKMAHNTDIMIDGNIARLEHASYFQRLVNLDLTLPAFVDKLKGAWAYGYDQQDLPNRETFGWSQPTDNEGGTFDGYPITYDNACVNDREEDEQTEAGMKSAQFLTNVQFVTGNEDFFDSKEILIVATNAFGVVDLIESPTESGFGWYSGPVYRLNGRMGLGYLLPRYHDFGRPFKKGYINKVLTTLYQPLPRKKQRDFTIDFTRDDFVNNFDASGLVKTQLAACEIDKARFEDPKQALTLGLKAK